MKFYEERVRKIVEAMGEDGVDAFLVTRASSVQYFTGCRTVSYPPRTLYTVIWSDGNVSILAPKLEVNQVQDEAALGEVVEVPRGDPSKAIGKLLAEHGVKRLGVEAGHISHWYSEKLRSGGLDLVDVSQRVKALRSRKDKLEIETLRRAVRAGEAGLRAAKEWVREGVPEKKVMEEAVRAMLSAGADWPSFETIVASGFRGAYPHGTATEKLIGSGDAVVVDLGARIDGYHSDLTRTFVAGRAVGEVLDVVEVVAQAVEAALKVIKPGVRAGDVDAAARAVISEAGYGEYFTHGLGHGIGLDIHEEPFIRPNSEDILAEGNVFTVEPGIYIPGVMGVRIEEDVVVTGGGVEVLSSFPRKPGL